MASQEENQNQAQNSGEQENLGADKPAQPRMKMKKGLSQCQKGSQKAQEGECVYRIGQGTVSGTREAGRVRTENNYGIWKCLGRGLGLELGVMGWLWEQRREEESQDGTRTRPLAGTGAARGRAVV
jgi:hypothetical protein